MTLAAPQRHKPPVPHAQHLSHGPSWRAMALLVLAVLLVHWLVLQAAPLQLMPRPGVAKPLPLSVPVLITRSIAPEPVLDASPPAMAPAPIARPAPVAQPKPVIPKPPARPPIAQPPVSAAAPAPAAAPATFPEPENASNQALAQAEPAQAAIDSIANPPVSAASGAAAGDAAADAAADATPPTTAPALQPPPVPQAAVAPALPPTPVSAVQLPASLTLRYRMTGSAKGLEYFANSELSWQNSGDAYQAGLRVSAFFLGSRSMSSQGQITPSGLAPTRFTDKSRSELAAHFEADKGKVTFSANTPDAPWLPGAQDRVSVFFQLSGILAAGPGNLTGATALPLGTEITVYTIGPREADTWTFKVEAEELLSLPAGDMVALKLMRKPRRPYDQQVEIWYAPSQAFMPVRSRITQANGDFIDQQLRAVERP